jgi:sugar O-acyltransferase (sialic acid O-acetyltransferase NeuD family)
MSKSPIVLVGAGGHAVACVDVIEQERRFEIVGLIGTDAEKGRSILGYPVSGTDEQLLELVSRFRNVLIAVGQIKTPEIRQRIFANLRALGAELPTIISPHAYVSSRATLGRGTIVMHGAIVNAGVVVGANCIINSKALIEHDAAIADHCHVATAAIINGGVRVGEGTFIGSNSTVRQELSIGARCVIGMAQRVVADCASGTWLPPAKRVPL